MSENTPNLALPYIMPSQAQKHVTHNEAIRSLDALVHLAVKDRNRTAPPADPSEGDRYVVAPDGEGPWQGCDGMVAAFQDGAWAYFTPRAGWIAFVVSEAHLIVFDGGQWQDYVSGSIPDKLTNMEGVGVKTTPDETNRLAIASPATLLTHEGSGHQLKINKNAAGDTASLLFQTNWSGRAEMGTTGSDDFTVKVSADGGSWRNALTIDAATGSVAFPQTVRLMPVSKNNLPAPGVADSGALAYVYDADGAAQLAYSDGGTWRKVRDGNPI